MNRPKLHFLVGISFFSSRLLGDHILRWNLSITGREALSSPTRQTVLTWGRVNKGFSNAIWNPFDKVTSSFQDRHLSFPLLLSLQPALCLLSGRETPTALQTCRTVNSSPPSHPNYLSINHIITDGIVIYNIDTKLTK